MSRKLYTLCLPLKGDQVLLGMKKRGFGAGRWNGFGGKVAEGETVMKAALRELYEEVGIQSGNLEKVGVLEFTFEKDPKVLETHIFSLKNFTEDPTETEEMSPQWFLHDNIPFDQMWPDDQLWLPYLLGGKKFRDSFLFDKPSDAEYTSKILKQQLEEFGQQEYGI